VSWELYADLERLRAELEAANKAYEYELTERRACEARIEAALAIADKASATDDPDVVSFEMVKALTGGREAEAKIDAALALIDKRLERTRSWSDVRTHDERNALRSIREALEAR
jgi:hypothetical protein